MRAYLFGRLLPRKRHGQMETPPGVKMASADRGKTDSLMSHQSLRREKV
jgi:hypothetical protein